MYETQVTVISYRSDVSAVKSGLSVKSGLGLVLGHWQTVQTQIRCHRTRRVIRICTICSNFRKLRVKWNSLMSPFGPFSQPTLRGNQPTSSVSALIRTGSQQSFWISLTTVLHEKLPKVPLEPFCAEDKLSVLILTFAVLSCPESFFHRSYFYHDLIAIAQYRFKNPSIGQPVSYKPIVNKIYLSSWNKNIRDFSRGR